MEYAAILAGCAAVSALCVAAAMGVFTRYTIVLDLGSEQVELRPVPGETPDVSGYEAVEDGLRFICWTDESGSEAEPELPASRDARYTARTGPELAGGDMQPWLSCDENGFALPDSPISGAEAMAGAEAVFAGDFSAQELAGLAEVSEAELASTLEEAFRPGELDHLDGTEPLSRREAARIICGLAGAQAPERVSGGAPDLEPSSEGAAELLLCLEPGSFREYEDGFVNVDGWLYFVRDGSFVRSETVNGLYLGADGRYSSGSKELDELVARTLDEICAGGGSRDELLREAYLYVRDSFDYLRRNYYEVGADGWQTDEALTMLTTRRGNCYCYAAAFCALARGLGYDATAVAGTVGYARSPHGWVIMYDSEGTRIVYDVELEMAYIYDRGIENADFYALEPLRAYRWSYVYGEQFA